MLKDIFQSAILLEDERALLRPLTAADYDNLLSFAMEEPELWKYSFNSPAGAEPMRGYIESTLKNKQAGNEYAFIIYDKQAGAYAGSTRFYDIQPANQAAQLGYTWYGKAFQRTGLNRHCKFLLLQFAFESWGLERVEFRADVNNERSIEAMKAIGCTVEGVLRSHAPTQGGRRRDSIVLSILKEEWFGFVKENLKGKIHG